MVTIIMSDGQHQEYPDANIARVSEGFVEVGHGDEVSHPFGTHINFKLMARINERFVKEIQ